MITELTPAIIKNWITSTTTTTAKNNKQPDQDDDDEEPEQQEEEEEERYHKFSAEETSTKRFNLPASGHSTGQREFASNENATGEKRDRMLRQD